MQDEKRRKEEYNERLKPLLIFYVAHQIRQESRLVSWSIVYTKQTRKDARKIASSTLISQAQRLLDVIATYPFQKPPPYERLIGDFGWRAFAPHQHSAPFGVSSL